MPQVIRILLSTRREAASANLEEPEDVLTRLITAGVDEIHLTGLSAFRAQMRNGSACDVIGLPIDPDAELLATAYHSLIRQDDASGAQRHWAYLGDGCVEINAIIDEDRVRIRIGEYRGWFEWDSEDGVTIHHQQKRILGSLGKRRTGTPAVGVVGIDFRVARRSGKMGSQ